MSAQRSGVSRRGMVGVLAAAAAAPALTACGAPSAPGVARKPTPALAATPSKPVTLNILDVAGNLQLTRPAIDAFAAAHPEIVSGINHTTGTAPQLAPKIQAEQRGGDAQTHLVLTGTDGLAAGIGLGLYTNLKPYYDGFFPNLMANYQPAAASMASLAQDQGIELVWYPSGPLLEYNPGEVAGPPDTAAALLDWAAANNGRFQYAQPRNSGPGRTFLMGLPYLLGDKDPADPVNGWDLTWEYLTNLGRYVASYPTGTGVTMKNLAAGTVAMIATTTGWYINGRAIGTVPAAMRVARFRSFTWVTDAQFGVVPRGVSDDQLTACLRLLAFLLTPEQQAVTYDKGYFYPGPAVRNVPVSQAPQSSRDVLAKFGVPDFERWMTQYPMRNSLPAAAQVTAFDLWDKHIGSAR